MKEHPIIFNSEMVKTILDGRKTQTRRVIRLCNTIYTEDRKTNFNNEIIQVLNIRQFGYWSFVVKWKVGGISHTDNVTLKCPYGKPGDRLWVRETCCITPKKWAIPDDSYVPDSDGDLRLVSYKADEYPEDGMRDYKLKWTPSIYMPRWASRITLEIDDIWVHRLQDITGDGMILEGMKYIDTNNDKELWHRFQDLWNSLHKKEHRWKDNPWVWVISFKRLEAQ